VLLSRQGPAAAGAKELQAELTQLGARVSLLACDAADRDALAQVVAAIPDDCPLTAVIHTAAALDDGPLESLTTSQAEAVLRAKVGVAWNLHDLTKHLDLSAFVLFSSTAGTFGAAGQGNYAPGNAFLDAFAQYRRAQGLVATSIGWGAWAEGGLADKEAVADLRRRHGVPLMSPQRALMAMQQAIGGRDISVVLADINWEKFGLAYTAVRPSPLLRDLAETGAVEPKAAEGAVPAEQGSQLTERIRRAPRGEQERVLRDLVRSHVAVVLGHDGPAAVSPGRAFWELGLDSVTALELRNRLNRATGRKLPVGLIFDYPTVDSMVTFLHGELCGSGLKLTQLMSDLDSLDAALAVMPDGDRSRIAVTERLEKIMRRMREAPAATRTLDLDTASHDEVFALIDGELGLSATARLDGSDYTDGRVSNGE
jgi:polyketide synthase 12